MIRFTLVFYFGIYWKPLTHCMCDEQHKEEIK